MSKYYERLVRKTVPARDGRPALLRLVVMKLPKPTLEDDEVLVKIGGSPINPSDLGDLTNGSDRFDEATVYTDEDGQHTLDLPLNDDVGDQESDFGWTGKEGAGVVEDAGKKARHFVGKTVFVLFNTWTQYGVYNKNDIRVQAEGVTPKQAASSFINPITVLAMLEKMRSEGHSAIVHTAAASQLGRMLVRACLADDVKLVNVVRRPEQAAELKALGAEFVVDTSAETFYEDLVEALRATEATIAFDALGGGNLANTILECMNHVSWWPVWKQVYIYGGLVALPQFLTFGYGTKWGIAGFLLSDFLESHMGEWYDNATARVANEISTTFRTDYGKEVSLRELLVPETLKLADSKTTGSKILVVP